MGEAQLGVLNAVGLGFLERLRDGGNVDSRRCLLGLQAGAGLGGAHLMMTAASCFCRATYICTSAPRHRPGRTGSDAALISTTRHLPWRRGGEGSANLIDLVGCPGDAAGLSGGGGPGAEARKKTALPPRQALLVHGPKIRP